MTTSPHSVTVPRGGATAGGGGGAVGGGGLAGGRGPAGGGGVSVAAARGTATEEAKTTHPEFSWTTTAVREMGKEDPAAELGTVTTRSTWDLSRELVCPAVHFEQPR